jgi:hypothetical protein
MYTTFLPICFSIFIIILFSWFLEKEILKKYIKISMHIKGTQKFSFLFKLKKKELKK